MKNRKMLIEARYDVKEGILRAIIEIDGKIVADMTQKLNAEEAEGYFQELAEGFPHDQSLKYPFDKPCPHCGGDPKITNPTGKCDHIHYPEGVNKRMRTQL
jgi:hypothetical protein